MRSSLKIGAILLLGFIVGRWSDGSLGGPLRSSNPPPSAVGRFQVAQGLWAGRAAIFVVDTSSGAVFLWSDRMSIPEPSSDGSWVPITSGIRLR
jgi:hypothetical protein